MSAGQLQPPGLDAVRHYRLARKYFLHSLDRPRLVSRAYPHIRSFLAKHPDNFEGLILAGYVAGEIDSRHAEALRYFDRAARIRPRSHDPVEERANALLGWGRPREAIAPALRALRMAERQKLRGQALEFVYDVTVSALVEGGRTREAARLLRRGLRKMRSGLLRSLIPRYARQWSAGRQSFGPR